MIVPDPASIAYTTTAIIRAAIITIQALLCNSAQVGQDTLCINSLYDSFKYVTNLFMVSNLI